MLLLSDDSVQLRHSSSDGFHFTSADLLPISAFRAKTAVECDNAGNAEIASILILPYAPLAIIRRLRSVTFSGRPRTDRSLRRTGQCISVTMIYLRELVLHMGLGLDSSRSPRSAKVIMDRRP